MARVLISMRDDFLKEVDELAEKEKRSRSDILRQAFRDYLKNNKVSK